MDGATARALSLFDDGRPAEPAQQRTADDAAALDEGDDDATIDDEDDATKKPSVRRATGTAHRSSSLRALLAAETLTPTGKPLAVPLRGVCVAVLSFPSFF